MRKWVTAPNGRYKGRWPQDWHGPQIEHELAGQLASQVKGAIEVVMLCGRADVATDTDVFEVEPVETWRRGLQQVLAYSGETGLQPNLALFTAIGGERRDLLDIYLLLRDRLKSPVKLWRHNGYGWAGVHNRGLAAHVLKPCWLGAKPFEGSRDG